MSFISICGIKEVQSAAEAEDQQPETILNSEHEQQHQPEMSVCHQIMLQLRLLIRFSQVDAVYNTCYFGLYVSEMGYLLSFLYINAWTSQFFIDQPDGL